MASFAPIFFSFLRACGCCPVSSRRTRGQWNSKTCTASCRTLPLIGRKSAPPHLGVVVLEPFWSQYEPQPGVFNAPYIDQLKNRLAAARRAGFRVVLSPGWQYPPAWIFQLPHSRYVNQYGDVFADPSPGMAGFNAVFNPSVRAHQETYLRRLLADLGTDFLALRLGGGWYNELNYPPNHYHDHSNCYWGFDDLAQGREPGFADGEWRDARHRVGCPERRYRPLAISTRACSSTGIWTASRIITIGRSPPRATFSTVRWRCSYPSWGIRPGQIDAAVAAGLSGKTSAEANGEVPRGFDFARFIHGITDPNVIVYCTWLDAHLGDDAGPGPGTLGAGALPVGSRLGEPRRT